MSNLILPAHMQVDRERQARINDAINIISNLLARFPRDGREMLVHRKYPRLPLTEIRRMSDARLWHLCDGEEPEPPRFLYMNRDDFYDLEPGMIEFIEAHNLEPIWGPDIRPGRVSLLPKSEYLRLPEMAKFHRETEDNEIGMNAWMA